MSYIKDKDILLSMILQQIKMINPEPRLSPHPKQPSHNNLKSSLKSKLAHSRSDLQNLITYSFFDM